MYDVIIIGAGAAGMMCGAVAGAQGQRVLILDHAKAAGEKIRISGGGRCNFTNIHSGPANFLSGNQHFCKCQLFCDDSAKQIIAMLLEECAKGGNEVRLRTLVTEVSRGESGYTVSTDAGRFEARSLVVACGGPSIPKMGATGYGVRSGRD